MTKCKECMYWDEITEIADGRIGNDKKERQLNVNSKRD